MALHDAIMLYAHAATKVLSEGGDLYNGSAMTAAVRSTRFKGVGGSTVVLNEQGDRIESWEVMNYIQGADGRMSSVPVGMYNNTLGQYKAYEQAVVWPGNTIEVPVDYFSGQLQWILFGLLADLQCIILIVHALSWQTSRSTLRCSCLSAAHGMVAQG